jgi:hypothetical protein
MLADPGRCAMASGITGMFRNLFGRGEAADAPAKAEAATEYNGYSIHPAPRRQGSGWLTAGSITKEFPDGVKEHQFIRADTYTDHTDAVAFCIQKAKQIIDEQGDRMFDAR